MRSNVRAAVVQAPGIPFDLEAALTSFVDLAHEAAELQPDVVVFPEAFIGGYPKGLDFGARLGRRSQEGRRDFQRYFDGALDLDEPRSDILGATARELAIHIVCGVIERAGGTLYCSALTYGPDGSLLAKRRKVMPTGLERLVWGFGDGSTLDVAATELGRIGAVICWENYMPLLRTAMYGQHVEIYCAPTVDDRENWISTMRTIAFEGRCFVISACQYLTASHLDRNLGRESGEEGELIRGGSCIIDPLGRVLLSPQFGAQGVWSADLDGALIAQGKYDLDVVGHYGRPDIFSLNVDRTVRRPVRYSIESTGTRLI